MAVEAQYLSNVLLLNPRNNNVQDSNKTADYSLLQPQLQPAGVGGGGYIHQSQHHHVLFNNNGAVSNNVHNSRKRGRRDVLSNMVPITNIFPPQDSSQFMNISQLHNHHNQHQNVVSTGIRMHFTDPNQLQIRHYHHNQEQNQEHNVNYSDGNSSSSSLLTSLLAGDISNQIKQHGDELDQFLQAQGDELRRTLADKRQKHYRTLLKATEESIALKLKQKSEEAEKTLRRNAELEARAAQLSIEAQLWQAKARQTEIAAVSLQAQLHHVITAGGRCVQNNAGYQNDNGLTCAAGGGGGANETGHADDAESACVDPDRVLPFAGPVCKGCTKRSATVILLPCRHLCVCTACDPLLHACPVCHALKDSSAEVFLS